MVNILVGWALLLFESLQSFLDQPCRCERVIFVSEGFSDVERTDKFIFWQIRAFSDERNIPDFIFRRRKTELTLLAVVHHHESIRGHRLNIRAVYYLVDVLLGAKIHNMISKATFLDLASATFFKLKVDALKGLHYCESLAMSDPFPEGLELFQIYQFVLMRIFILSLICLSLCCHFWSQLALSLAILIAHQQLLCSFFEHFQHIELLEARTILIFLLFVAHWQIFEELWLKISSKGKWLFSCVWYLDKPVLYCRLCFLLFSLLLNHYLNRNFNYCELHPLFFFHIFFNHNFHWNLTYQGGTSYYAYFFILSCRTYCL